MSRLDRQSQGPSEFRENFNDPYLPGQVSSPGLEKKTRSSILTVPAESPDSAAAMAGTPDPSEGGPDEHPRHAGTPGPSQFETGRTAGVQGESTIH